MVPAATLGTPAAQQGVHYGMTCNTETSVVPRIRFIANLSKKGEKKLVIYVPVNNPRELLKAFKDKPMIVTCEEAIKDESEEERKK